MSTPQQDISALLKVGDLSNARSAIKAFIRQAPTDPDLRFMLFQVQALIGEWEGASDQLLAFYELNGRQSPLPLIFNEVIQAEVRRKHVFFGEESPVVFGEPPAWIPLLVQGLSHAAKGEWETALALRAKAVDEAPPVAGKINGEPFNWLMDGDSRLGPVLEIIIKGQYYWMPQSRVRTVTMSTPEQIRDAVWAAATLELETGATVSAFIPVRYPGESKWMSDALKLARTTAWDEPCPGFYVGSGQRVWMTDTGESSVLETRKSSSSTHSSPH